MRAAAPVQARIINITADQEPWAKQVHADLTAAGVRAELDLRNEKLGFKIREAQVAKVPYMIVIGDKEKDAQTVAARHWEGNQLAPMPTSQFIEHVKAECGAQWGL